MRVPWLVRARGAGQDGERRKMDSGAHTSTGWIFGKLRGLEEL
jgi:hypothetical protein